MPSRILHAHQKQPLGGHGGAAPGREAREVLQGAVLPTFDRLALLEKSRKVLAGGLPVGERAFVMIVNARSNEELDEVLRDLPMWAALDWQVTPLQTFRGRAATERAFLRKMRKAT